jgi:hypothetical protein
MTRSFPIDSHFFFSFFISIIEDSDSADLNSLKDTHCLFSYNPDNMPPIRSARNRKPPPAGFEDLEDTLLEFSNKMKDAENAPHEGKKKYEVLWPIFQISHQRTFTSIPGKAEAVLTPSQAHDTFMTFTTKKKPFQSSCMTGF